MRYCYSLLLLFCTSTVYAQQNYDVSLIPKELLSHANAVVRHDETTVTVKNLDDVTQHAKYTVTILNKNGDDEANMYFFYDKTEHIKSVKGIIYDETGKPIRKFNEGDFEDHSSADGFSLFRGERYKYYQPAITTYPYTVSYEYETSSDETMFLPSWTAYPNHSKEASVEYSSYKLICKSDFNIRYKELNYTGKVTVTEDKGFKTYSFEASNLKALRAEPYSPPNEKLFPTVQVAPEKFQYGDISGSFTNWDEFGSFIYRKLLGNRQILPPETVAFIKDLTKDITDPKLKAKKIYEYMQQKTRYVSVQIGIGGYQPFTATEVDQSGYGDCKALVNYTQSLLNSVGIESYYILNKSGNLKANALPDFASMNQFDHVILCLPFKNDTTWIDCTSKENPFGYLGDFTDDRWVVACTATGGKLMHTPKYPTEGNKQTRTGNFILAADGTLTGQIKTEFKGTQYDNREELVNETFAEQVKKVKDYYPIENLNITAYNLIQDKNLDPVTIETIKLQARDYMAPNGDRYFFTPNTASRYIKPIKSVMNRINDVYINRGYLDVDEISYDLPQGFTITTKPLSMVLDQPFGKYSVSTEIIGHKLIYKRRLQLNSGTFSKELYENLVDFLQNVYDADNYTVAMVKK